MRTLCAAILLSVFCFFSPALAAEFDCNFPPFGSQLEELGNTGDFVKYKEKNGISYYNYTGKCVLPIHERVNPAISYGFINNQLYTKIVSYSVKEANKDNPRAFKQFLMKHYGDQLQAKPKMKIEGDWEIYRIMLTEKDVKIKLKLNKVTQQVKTAWYYEPLRASLK